MEKEICIEEIQGIERAMSQQLTEKINSGFAFLNETRSLTEDFKLLLSSVLEELHNAQNEIRVLEQEKAALNEQSTRMDAELREVKAKQSMYDEMELTVAKSTSIFVKAEALKKKLSEKQKVFEKEKEEFDRVKSGIMRDAEENKQRAERAEQEKADAIQRRDQILVEKRKLETQIQQLREEKQKIYDYAVEKKAKVEELNEVVNRQEEIINELNNIGSSLKKRNQELEEEVANRSKYIETIENSIQQKETELDYSKKKMEEFRNYSIDVDRKIYSYMKELDKKPLKGHYKTWLDEKEKYDEYVGFLGVDSPKKYYKAKIDERDLEERQNRTSDESGESHCTGEKPGSNDSSPVSKD